MRILIIAVSFIISSCVSYAPLDDSNSNLVKVEINSNNESLFLSVYNEDRKISGNFGAIPMNTTIRIAKTANVKYSVSGYDDVENYIWPQATLKPNELNEIKATVELRSRLEKIKGEYYLFDKDTKKNIIEAITAYTIAKESPKFQVDSKIAEADGRVALIKADNEKFKESMFSEMFNKLSIYLKLSSMSGSLDRDVGKIINLLNSSTN